MERRPRDLFPQRRSWKSLGVYRTPSASVRSWVEHGGEDQDATVQHDDADVVSAGKNVWGSGAVRGKKKRKRKKDCRTTHTAASTSNSALKASERVQKTPPIMSICDSGQLGRQSPLQAERDEEDATDRHEDQRKPNDLLELPNLIVLRTETSKKKDSGQDTEKEERSVRAVSRSRLRVRNGASA